LVGEGCAVPDADDQGIRGTEVVFEDIGEFGAGLGATKGAGVDHAATEGVAMHGFHQDRAGEFVGFSGVIFALVGAEVEGGFDFTGIVWRDAFFDLACAATCGIEIKFRLHASGGVPDETC
jgi:hypothetical protein